MAFSRRTPNGSSGSSGGHVSPFIKRDRFKRNFMKRQVTPNKNQIAVKKEDPDSIEAREKRLLGVESINGASGVKKENNADDEFNEFPLRAISKERLENMRTHLLKFQSKKKIDPRSSFHQPIRLHRKDTRNLQFQLTRAEIVQRQKEITEYKKKQDQEKAGIPSTGNSTASVIAGSSNVSAIATPVSATITATGTPDTSTTPNTGTPGLNAQDNNSLANGGTVENKEGSNAEGVPGTSNAPSVTPIVTQLEEAGISEHPEKVGMVTYDGKEEPELGLEPGTSDPMADVAPDGGGRARRINSKRKTRQLKVLDENAKKLRFEEFYPWVMEDFDGYNTWVGSYEAGNSDSYVMLSVEDDGSFTMIPADKVYKFTARNKYATLTIDEAEKRMDKKAGEVPRWLMKHLDNIGTTTTRYDRTKRRLKAVADQRNLDDEEHSDNSEVELDYDEEFADDEEAPIIDGNEQENKESEQRIKREMLQANAMGLRDDEIIPENEEDDLFNEKKIDDEGEKIKKALQKTELAALYSSDEDDINPYLSESDLENKESSVKKEVDEEKEKEKLLSQSEKGSKSPVKKEKSPSVHTEPRIRVKSIKDCIIILKAEKKILETFPPGVWNENAKKRPLGDSTEFSKSSSPVIKQEDPASKKIKLEDGESQVRLITEQDIIDAIGDGVVNVKDFGKSIRKKYPGPENKKLMFAIVKKLCRKVDKEHMELKK